MKKSKGSKRHEFPAKSKAFHPEGASWGDGKETFQGGGLGKNAGLDNVNVPNTFKSSGKP